MPKIIDRKLYFDYLEERSCTKFIIIHHTGNPNDDDLNAEQIHRSHIAQGYSGIGYHYVIRKNGDIEAGRPYWTVGAHAVGWNYETIGVHICGNFQIAKPTDKQLDSAAKLIAYLCSEYDLPIDNDRIMGHCDLMSTACPGVKLYKVIPDIIEKARAYDDNEVAEPMNEETPLDEIEKLAILARRYESNNNPACVSSGEGDVGGISYGLYQLSSNVGSVQNFIDWLKKYPDKALANYGRVLSEYKINTPLFISTWRDLGQVDPGNFGKLQDEFIKEQYYDAAVAKLKDEYYQVYKHTDALKAVIFARAVQNGVSGCVSLLKLVTHRMGYANMSYIDSYLFDRNFIYKIYEFLIHECDGAQRRGDIYVSANNFCKGSAKVISALRNRFSGERYDALNMLG